MADARSKVQEHTPVGLGELVVTDDPGVVLMCPGLGSCVGVCAYDSVAKVAGMAHVVLPAGEDSRKDSKTMAKFANIGVPALLEKMYEKGAVKSRIRVKIAGGASMVIDPGFADHFKTGERNIKAGREALRQSGLAIAASEVGGHRGRTLRLFAGSGEVLVESAGKQTIKL
jgi:chemotaxis protein CheD